MTQTVTAAQTEVAPMETLMADQAMVALDPAKPPASPEERARIDEIKASLATGSQASILELGINAERDIAAFADSVLEKVMARDTGDAHEKLTEIKMIAKGLDPESLKEKSGFLARIFWNAKKELTKFSDRFMSARDQIDAIAIKVEDDIQEYRYGLAVLEQLFEQTQRHFVDLKLNIEAGHELLDEWRTKLAEAEAEAAARPDDHMAQQRVRDTKNAIELLDRKVMNLEKSRSIAYMHMPTIRQVQQTGIMLIQEMHMMLTQAVPTWKTNMVINLEQMRQRRGLKSVAAMTDFTNDQLTTMAKNLEDNTVELHQQTARGIADVDKIVEAMGSLMTTLDRVDALEAESRKARADGRQKLADMQSEFAKRHGEPA